MKPALLFNARTHTFTVDHERIPHVSLILAQDQRLGLDRLSFLADGRAADRGTRLHRMLVKVDSDERAIRALRRGSDIEKLVQQYLLWKEAMRPVWTHVEQRLWHPALRFAGIPDRIGYLRRGAKPGSPVVVDFKSGAPAKWHGLQTAAYDLLMPRQPGGEVRRRITLYLQDTRIRAKEHTDPDDYVRFLLLLGQYRRTHAEDSF